MASVELTFFVDETVPDQAPKSRSRREFSLFLIEYTEALLHKNVHRIGGLDGGSLHD